MALPETVRVKISSEAAQSIALTPVLRRDMPVRDLIEMLLGATGKDAARVRRLLGGGTLVSGGSRLRWEGWTPDPADLEAVLATFPDPDPSRPFDPAACVRAVLKGPDARIEIARAVGLEHRLFHKERFWDVLLELAAASPPRYRGYSYRDRADRYAFDLEPPAAARLRECAARLRYSSLEAQVRRARIETIEFFAERPE